jgi:cell division protein FtsQ
MMRSSRGSVSPLPTRRWRRRVRAARPVLLALAVVALVLFSAWAVLFSALLTVERVQVSGVHTLSPRAVTQAAAVGRGTPMARVNLDDVTRRVEALPAVASDSVHRGWPHTISITVRERQPVGTLQRAGRWWLVDATGSAFEPRPTRPPAQPLLAVQGSHPAEVVREAASVLSGLPAHLDARVDRVAARSIDSITLVLKDGRQVRWGSAAEATRKAQVLTVLLTHPARFYDVSVPEDPTTSNR